MEYGDLTERQYKILEFIVETIQERGWPPTLKEIGAHFSIASSRGVRDHLAALQRKGYIIRKPWTSRGIELVQEKVRRLFFSRLGIPLVGRVAAGKPILAVENIEDVLTFERLFPKDERIFALRVEGDSMEEAGIFAGDILFVRQQSTAEIGDIVVALIGDEATVKRFGRAGDHIRLESANPKYQPIIVKDAQIVGKVIKILREIR